MGYTNHRESLLNFEKNWTKFVKKKLLRRRRRKKRGRQKTAPTCPQKPLHRREARKKEHENANRKSKFGVTARALVRP